MRVFVTGASGFIGMEVTRELLAAGHSVLGLARSDEASKSVAALGADVHRGSIEDLDSLKTGAAAADAVIHLAFNHDFTRFAENCKDDGRAITAMGETLMGSKRPFIVTGGLGGIVSSTGGVLTEQDQVVHNFPRVSEPSALKLIETGVSAAVVRLPQVHNTEKQGLVTYMVALAKEKGVSAYVGDGQTRFAAVHISDCARLYRLALENHQTGSIYHAVAETGVPLKSIAEAIGKRLNVPVTSIPQDQAAAHFGFLSMFTSMNLTGSSEWTQKQLNWKPTGPDLLSDLKELQLVA